MSQVSGRKDGYEILHDNPATPGTSGGPLLDTNGRLVGINGESIFDVNSNKSFGAGIPIALYLENSSEGIAATNTSPPTDLISLGERKAKTGDYQGAIAYYNQAIKSDPHNLKAYYLRGEAYLKLGNCVLGLEDFNRVIALNGKNTCHSELGNKREAVRNYNKAIEIYPDFARAYYNRGITSYQLPVTSYQLAVTSYQLPVTSYQLPVSSYQLPVTSYQLPVSSYQLPVTSYQLPVTSYQLPVTISNYLEFVVSIRQAKTILFHVHVIPSSSNKSPLVAFPYRERYDIPVSDNQSCEREFVSGVWFGIQYAVSNSCTAVISWSQP